MLRVRCSKCGFVFYEGREIMDLNEILMNYLKGDVPRCPRCLKRLEISKIILKPKNPPFKYRHREPLVIEVGG